MVLLQVEFHLGLLLGPVRALVGDKLRPFVGFRMPLVGFSAPLVGSRPPLVGLSALSVCFNAPIVWFQRTFCWPLSPFLSFRVPIVGSGHSLLVLEPACRWVGWVGEGGGELWRGMAEWFIRSSRHASVPKRQFCRASASGCAFPTLRLN